MPLAVAASGRRRHARRPFCPRTAHRHPCRKEIAMKKGLTQICLGRNSSIRDALQMCREIGYQGLEILLTENGELTMRSGPDDYAALRKMSAEAGVELTSICGGGDISSNDPAAVADSKARIRKMLEAAEALGI